MCGIFGRFLCVGRRKRGGEGDERKAKLRSNFAEKAGSRLQDCHMQSFPNKLDGRFPTSFGRLSDCDTLFCKLLKKYPLENDV